MKRLGSPVIVGGLVLLLLLAAAGLSQPATTAQASSSNRATVEFKSGDNVTFLRVTLPNGRVIIREIGKK